MTEPQRIRRATVDAEWTYLEQITASDGSPMLFAIITEHELETGTDRGREDRATSPRAVTAPNDAPASVTLGAESDA